MAPRTPSRTREVRVLLSPAQDSRLDAAAKRWGVTKSAIIRVALDREFALDEQLARESAGAASPERKKSRGALQPLLF